jgi:hypothetical protein
MSTFNNEYLHFVETVSIVPWETFDADYAEFLIGGEL